MKAAEGENPMKIIVSGEVAFVLSAGGVVENVVLCPGNDANAVTCIFLPQEVKYHRNQNMYRQFPNLQEILAHPESKQYRSYDGALYNKMGSLVLVPTGKETLHLAPFTCDIQYRALDGLERLREITVDREHPFFMIKNGCLMSRDEIYVHFVADPKRMLYLGKNTTVISKSVLGQPLSGVVIEEGNPYFFYGKNMLCRGGKILRLFQWDTVCIPNCITQITPEEAYNLLARTESICVEEGNPVFWADGNCLFDRQTKEVIFVGKNAEKLTMPEGYQFSKGCLSAADRLREISVPCDLSVRKEAFSFTQLEAKRRAAKAYTVTVRLPEENAFTVRGELRQVLRAVNGADVEVRAGTELVYLELFLSGKLQTSLQLRSIAVSALSILRELIRREDAARLHRVLEDGRLVTEKNIARLLRYAGETQNAEIVAMLLNAKNGQLPHSMSWAG